MESLNQEESSGADLFDFEAEKVKILQSIEDFRLLIEELGTQFQSNENKLEQQLETHTQMEIARTLLKNLYQQLVSIEDKIHNPTH